MDDIIATESWRQIPPEEKIEMMTQAHTTGVFSGLSTIFLGATFSIGYQVPELFWISLIASPVVFQFAATRKWRALRPLFVLMYLAARSAARRYAYAVKSQDMSVRLIFRGTLQHMPFDTSILGKLDAEVSGIKKIPAWIVLFPDCVIVMSEAKGGAKMEFGKLINDRMTLQLPNRDMTDERAIYIQHEDRRLGIQTIRLDSYQPAALSVFATKLKEYLDLPQQNKFENERLEDRAA